MATRRSRNSTRDREKAELLSLRRLSAELEALVACLRAPEGAKGPLRAASSTWRRVAERQKLAKHASERKNRRLMAQAQRNAEWIHRLWDLLRETRGPRLEPLASAPSDERTRDAALFQRLKSDAELAGRRALEAFAAEGIQPPGSGLNGWEEQERWAFTLDVPGGSCRLVGVRRVPFDMLTVSEAVWAALVGPSFIESPGGSDGAEDCDVVCKPSILQAIDRSHDACAMKLGFGLSLDASGERSSHVDSRIVAQRVRGGEARGSQLFVWRMQSVLEKDAGALRVECNDVMWVAVSSCSGSVLASTIAVVAQSRVRSVAVEDNPDYGEVTSKFGAILLGDVESCIKDILDATENSLLDGAMGRRATADTATDALVVV